MNIEIYKFSGPKNFSQNELRDYCPNESMNFDANGPILLHSYILLLIVEKIVNANLNSGKNVQISNNDKNAFFPEKWTILSNFELRRFQSLFHITTKSSKVRIRRSDFIFSNE